MIQVRLICQLNDYLNDAQDIPRAFSPTLIVNAEADHYLGWETNYKDGTFFVKIFSDVLGEEESSLTIERTDGLLYKKLTKRFLKNRLYDFLSKKLDVVLPYGSLTGVRPTKLYYELLEQKKDPSEVLKNEFRVSETRISILHDCVDNQKNVRNESFDAVALFVNIPFCPTRCSYCSFISTEVGRIKKEIPRYVESVKRELVAIKEAVVSSGKRVTSIYVGGGTPGSIGAEQLGAILSELSDFNVEFTVEAGRPDTIDDELLSVLSSCGVTRISINPQTFKQETLDRIGRKHSVAAVYDAFSRSKGRFSINMDLIAGLPGESEEDFLFGLQETVGLRPENVTVHSLSLKRGSVMTQEGVLKSRDGSVRAMTDRSIRVLYENGYRPYYLYRQKNTLDNLENVGYCLPGQACKYNVDMMEESIIVLGAGAGAMTKIVSGGRIERIANPKGFREYVDRIDAIVDEKKELF